MTKQELDVINQMYITIKSLSCVLGEVASYRCYGREKLVDDIGELKTMMTRLLAVNAPVEITAEMVGRLRIATGEGVMSCKKALVSCKGNHMLAKEYLRQSGTVQI